MLHLKKLFKIKTFVDKKKISLILAACPFELNESRGELMLQRILINIIMNED